MKENENTGDEARAAILAARGDGLMADALARRASGAGWEPAVYVDGEGAAGGMEGFFRTGGEVLLVALERGMKLGGDGEEALFLAMRAGLRIIPVGGEDAAAVWRAVAPPDMPELGGVEARRLEDGWEGLLAGNGKKDAHEGKEGATRGCRGKGISLWAVLSGVCAAALAAAFFIPGIRGNSPDSGANLPPAPVVKPAPSSEVSPSRPSEVKPAPFPGRGELLNAARSIRRGKDPEKYKRVMEELRRRGHAGDRACRQAYELLKRRDGDSASAGNSVPAPVVKPAPSSEVPPSRPSEVKPAPSSEVPPSRPSEVKPAPFPGRGELLNAARSIRPGMDPEKYGHVMEELRRRGRAGDKACQNAYKIIKKRDSE